MIEHAIGNLPPAAGTYADALPAVLGRPVALTYSGWSLELAALPHASHAFSDMDKDTYSALDYEFHLKLGDKSASYDGLIGYFTLRRNQAVRSFQQYANERYVDCLHTLWRSRFRFPTKYVTPASDSYSALLNPYYIQAEPSSTPESISAARSKISLHIWHVHRSLHTREWIRRDLAGEATAATCVGGRTDAEEDDRVLCRGSAAGS
ncbi:hypothetical protein CERZMDRAFT_92535 [Cercospora zeae-maydis SCOH1-5]|uniref:Uncharacterized protein n=1 Tax=Cercospora zeae-maydis SCOH1-5 TaxID=717836 RepID=A0A6A6FWY4_9PEZI|nr:hypothetical protein CERZMDRAFT_92535 [Cercospora zeae-maydis SCOH1-5]